MLFIRLISILILAVSLQAQQIRIPGPGGAAPAATGYTGPGDLGISGIQAFYGLRCYSTSFTGTIAQIFDAATGTTTETILTCPGGGVINETVNPLSTTCAAGCVIQALFDQSGQNNCSGVCIVFNNTNARRATFTRNCIGSLPCATRAGGANTLYGLFSGSFPTIAQPFTVSTVCERTGATTTQTACIWPSNGGGFVGPSATANDWTLYAGTIVNSSAADNVIHAAQVIYNGASSTFYLDGSSNTINPGTLGTQSALFIMSDTNNSLNGNFFEAGVWSGAFSGAQLSAMNANQHAYWGF